MTRSESANYHRWKPEELDALKANWRTMTGAELALETGHSLTSVQSKMQKLGIRLHDRPIPKARGKIWNFAPLYEWTQCAHSETR